jgi:predicted esterase
MKGNTLIRGRHFFLDKDTLVLSVDAPSDEWGNFSHHFRRGARYGKDVRALLQEVMKQYPVADWTFVGHSEGAVSAYGAGVPNLDLVNRLVLVSSVFVPTKNGPGISGLDWDMLNKRLLFVHHENDPCQYTPYRSAKQYAEKTGSPLLTVRGGTEPSGDPCRALSEHGLPGMEQQTFEAIRTWSRAGDVPATVGP